MSELAYKRTNVYEIADEKLMKEIFDYAEAAQSVFVSDKEIKNPSKQTVYLSVDGLRLTLAPGESK